MADADRRYVKTSRNLFPGHGSVIVYSEIDASQKGFYVTFFR